MKNIQTTSAPHEATTFNWRDFHERLEAAQTTLAAGAVLSPERKKAVLAARAKLLAEAPQNEDKKVGRIEVVAFLLAQERYGIESTFVREVYPLKALTPLPCTPPFVLGIVNIRGQILSLIDLKKFFGLPEKGLAEKNRVIVLRSQTQEFGILADAVSGAQEVALQEIQSEIPTLTGLRREYLKGISDEGIIVLDAEKILADRNIVVHEHVEG